MHAARTSALSLALAFALGAPAMGATPAPVPTLHIRHVDILLGTEGQSGAVPFYYASPQGVRNTINIPGETAAMRLTDVWYEPLSDLTVLPQYRTINFGVETGGRAIVGSFRSAAAKASPLMVRVFYSYLE